MSTLQKTIVALALTALGGTAIYEARQAANANAKLQTLQQQQNLLTSQMQQLQRERDISTSQVAPLRHDNEQLARENAELPKLRAEVAHLRAGAQQATQLTNATLPNPTESTASTWVNRVSKLKQRLEQTPEAGIPELKLLSDADWLAAVRELPLDTQAEYRAAMSTLRRAAETKAGSLISKALRAFTQANSGQLPTDLAQLQPYFDSPLDMAILNRWEIADQKTVPNVDVGQTVITQKAPVDEVFDRRLVFSPGGGSGSTDWLSVGRVIAPVLQAYRAANNGQHQTDYSQLLPYATTPEQVAAIQNLILKFSVPRTLQLTPGF